MASSLTLDRSDPGVDELVSGWKDGGTYTVELTIKQTKSSPNAANYEVTGISEVEGMEEEMEEEAVEEQVAAPKKARTKPEVAVEY